MLWKSIHHPQLLMLSSFVLQLPVSMSVSVNVPQGTCWQLSTHVPCPLPSSYHERTVALAKMKGGHKVKRRCRRMTCCGKMCGKGVIPFDLTLIDGLGASHHHSTPFIMNALSPLPSITFYYGAPIMFA